MSEIRATHAREVLDSRGNPTVEVEMWLDRDERRESAGRSSLLQEPAR